MTRHQLERLSNARLCDIILRQEELIEQQQAQIEQQQVLIEQLQARVAVLEDLGKRLTQPPEDASNSPTPPSTTRKANRSNRKPREQRGPKPKTAAQ